MDGSCYSCDDADDRGGYKYERMMSKGFRGDHDDSEVVDNLRNFQIRCPAAADCAVNQPTNRPTTNQPTNNRHSIINLPTSHHQ